VANFTVAQTPRTFDRQSNEWKDGETVWMRCAVWRDTAENVAASLHKGDRVIVRGRLKQRTYEKDGQNHTVTECEVDEVGAALRYAEVRITKAERQQGGQQQPQQGGWGQQPQQGGPPPQQADPWAGQPAPQPPAQGWGAPPPQQQQPQPAQQPWGAPPPAYGEPPF
jgi:single-strand DNA-binding protein